MTDGPRPHRRFGGPAAWMPLLVSVPLVAGVVAAGAVILKTGNGFGDEPAPSTGRTGGLDGLLDPAARFLLAVALVMVLTHGFGRLARRLGQPPVVGEIAAGIVLGPSLLASVSPHLHEYLFPQPVLSALSQVAQLGLVLFMFLVGWEVDVPGLRRRSRAMVMVSFASLAVPFVSGLAVALVLYRSYGSGRVGFTPFALFVGLALAITAMPVLARILEDTGLSGTAIGGLAIASAVVEDAAAWTLLAAALAFANVSAGLPPWLIIVLALAFAVTMVAAVRPVLARVLHRAELRRATERGVLPLVIIGILASAVMTSAIGIHAIFGAFLFGLIMPRGAPATEVVRTRIQGLTAAALLPLFFAVAGMNTSIGSLGGWLLPAVVFVLAVLTKLFGAGLAARVAGLPWRDAYAVGVLMNCRGLTEIVIASVGLQFGIIDGRLFTTLVLVALGTTALTTPLLRLRFREGLPAHATRTTGEDVRLPERVGTPAISISGKG